MAIAHSVGVYRGMGLERLVYGPKLPPLWRGPTSAPVSPQARHETDLRNRWLMFAPAQQVSWTYRLTCLCSPPQNP